MNIVFWILWSIVALSALIVFYFFFMGIADGSVSSFNIALWLVMVIGIPLILAGSYWLKNHDYIRWGIAILLLPALPALGYFLFLIAVLLAGPTRWN